MKYSQNTIYKIKPGKGLLISRVFLCLRTRFPLFLACFVSAIIIFSEGLVAKDLGKQVNATLKELPKWIQAPDFEYQPQKNPDPFERFLELGDKQEEKQKSRQELTPLERIQPSQVELRGIMWYSQNPDKALALIELPNGKGYILKENTKIGGRNGRVKNILPGKVVIQQELTNVLGKKETKTVLLKLDKSTGENNE